MLWFFRLFFPVLVICFLLIQADIEKLLESIRSGDQLLLVVSLVFSFFLIFLQAFRWYILAGSFEFKVSFFHLQKVNFIAMAFDAFIPGKLGSDTYRLMRSSTKDLSKSVMLGVLFVLRLQTLAFGGGSALLALVFWYWGGKYFYCLLFLLGAVFFIFYFFRDYFLPPLLSMLTFIAGFIRVSGRVRDILNASANTIVTLLQNPRVQFTSIMILLVYIFSNIVIFWIISISFNINISFFTFVYSVPVILFASNIPFTVHGRGVTELFAVFFWRSELVSIEQVLVVCWSVYALALVQSFSAAVLLLLSGFRFSQIKDIDSERLV